MPPETKRKPEQVNVTLSPEDHDVLQALAFVEQASAASVLRPVVERYLREQRDTPEVELALTALARRRACALRDQPKGWEKLPMD